MFWRFGGYAQLSSLDSILDKPDVTVDLSAQYLRDPNSKGKQEPARDLILEKALDLFGADTAAAPKKAARLDADSFRVEIAA